MSPELQDAFVKAFPNLYADLLRERPIEPIGQRGFEIGDGWVLIVWQLSEKLEKLGGIECHQCKEKFGGLRFYFGAADKGTRDEADKLIKEAESRCWRTCMECGDPGVKRDGGWLRVLCDSCEQEYQARKWP